MEKFVERLANLKTTVAGIVTASIGVLTQILYAVDSNPDTTMSTEVLLMSLATIGAGVSLLFAKD